MFYKELISTLKVLLIASLISSLGGVSLELISEKLVTIVPVVILIPALNHMCGSFGTIVSSKFTSLLYNGKIDGGGIKDNDVTLLFKNIISIVLIVALYVSFLSLFVSYILEEPFDFYYFIKIPLLTLIISLSLFFISFNVAVITGLYLYKKKKDPDDFLIPITTAISDLGSTILISIFTVVFL